MVRVPAWSSRSALEEAPAWILLVTPRVEGPTGCRLAENKARHGDLVLRLHQPVALVEEEDADVVIRLATLAPQEDPDSEGGPADDERAALQLLPHLGLAQPVGEVGQLEAAGQTGVTQLDSLLHHEGLCKGAEPQITLNHFLFRLFNWTNTSNLEWSKMIFTSETLIVVV